MTTTPPKLTDEPIDAEWSASTGGSFVTYDMQAFARAIESAVNQQWLDLLAAAPGVDAIMALADKYADQFPHASCNEVRDRLRTAVEQALAVRVLAGWKLVPVEPTLKMLAAFKARYKEGDFWRERIHGAVAAMLAAAPQPPQQPAEQARRADGVIFDSAIHEHLSQQPAEQRPPNCGTGFCSCIECIVTADDPIYAATELAWRAGWTACRDAEFIGEEAEDDAWGYAGATVAKDVTTKLREKNGGGK